MDFEHFKAAQDQGHFDRAMAELEAGQKQSHWVWFVFPQIAGIGTSAVARKFGIPGEQEAIGYVSDPILRARLLLALRLVNQHHGMNPRDLMGSLTDAKKLVSCATLFHLATVRDSSADEITQECWKLLGWAVESGLPPCLLTLHALHDVPVCQVCEGPTCTTFPHSSGVAPYSYLQCLPCMLRGLESEETFRLVYQHRDGMGLPSHIDSVATLVGGERVLWPDWVERFGAGG